MFYKNDIKILVKEKKSLIVIVKVKGDDLLVLGVGVEANASIFLVVH